MSSETTWSKTQQWDDPTSVKGPSGPGVQFVKKVFKILDRNEVFYQEPITTLRKQARSWLLVETGKNNANLGNTKLSCFLFYFSIDCDFRSVSRLFRTFDYRLGSQITIPRVNDSSMITKFTANTGHYSQIK